jgi:hypothetical protein
MKSSAGLAKDALEASATVPLQAGAAAIAVENTLQPRSVRAEARLAASQTGLAPQNHLTTSWFPGQSWLAKARAGLRRTGAACHRGNEHEEPANADLVHVVRTSPRNASIASNRHRNRNQQVRCIVLLHDDMNCSNLRCKNALDSTVDLNDRIAQALGNSARERDEF